MEKCLTLSSFVSDVGFRCELTIAAFFSCFVDIIGDFAWRPLVKQVKPTGRTMPPSTANSPGQPY